MWKLMHDEAISEEDRLLVSDFIIQTKRLTYGPKIKEFENKWSEWLGVNYSVFVNSGSSANLLIVQAAHDLYGHGNWAAQSCTWSTNVAPILQLQKNSGIYLTDVDLNTLGPCLEDLVYLFENHNIKYLFLTHVLGIPSISSKLLEICKQHKVLFFEDCCESHGSNVNGKKVGTFGKASSFSFFYGHHITTIEGGMICTDDEEFYHRLLLLRSHGLLRELPEEKIKNNTVKGVDPKFTFLCPGYNVRNTDVNAVLGINQMKRLPIAIDFRNKNFKLFVENLDSNKYHTDFCTDGVSSFALPIIAKNVSIDKVSEALNSFGIEYRPLIAGNLLRHPMMDSVNTFRAPFKNSNHIHDNSFYVGNNEFIKEENIKDLIYVLNLV